MVAIILAGGQSSRLAPYTDDILPKILLPVEKADDGSLNPLVDRLLRQCGKAGASEIIVVCNYRNEPRISRMIEGRAHAVIQEGSEQLSAVVTGLSVFKDEDYVVVDGDNFFDSDETIRAFVEDAKGNTETLTVGTFNPDRFDKYAMIIEAGGIVDTIVEKPAEWEHPMRAKSGLLFIPKSCVHNVCKMKRGGAQTTTDVIAKWKGVQCVPISGTFTDIGTWDEYTYILRSACDVY